MTEADTEAEADGFRSGFVAMFGRPNTGKSTIVNKIVGEKVSITSNKAQTTRHQIRGVLTTPDAQVVFVDTPGVGKPRTALGEKLNVTARQGRVDADVVCFVVDARSGYGRGDAYLVENLDPDQTVLVLNKIDGMEPAAIAEQLTLVAPLGFSAYFPVSGFTGAGLKPLVEHLIERLPEGPRWFPNHAITDVSDSQWVAELVREQLLRILRQELPHSVATRVVEWEDKRIKVEILVERESQKGIVIGKGGAVLKKVGTNVRKQLAPGYHLELVVSVEPNWQHDPAGVERMLRQ
ncbi:MAG: GTPase Era [Acidimicrobiales bacterium]|nr:GTPase Era [Acidimicrobiales bacterium]